MNNNTSAPAKKLNSRCYLEYVDYMIRFFLTSPDSLIVQGHSAADVKNWIAVQTVYADLTEEEQAIITAIYTARDKTFRDIITDYCKQTNTDQNSVWALAIRVCKRIASERGLI